MPEINPKPQRGEVLNPPCFNIKDRHRSEPSGIEKLATSISLDAAGARRLIVNTYIRLKSALGGNFTPDCANVLPNV
jgi:hypothetical protein